MMRLNDKAQRVDLKLATSMVALVLASMAAPALAAADDQEAAAAEGSKEDTTIIVTGTRRTDRTVAESAVPIDVFSADDFKAQPSPQLQNILKTLVPSFNQNRNLLGDASAFVRPPNLRGLPADQILVLINGKRMHRSALVQVTGDSLNAGSQGPDLSQISSPAVSRIEVLRDGAAAQYGSDAIAGVINIGLNRSDSGYNLAARYGQTYRGDGEDLQLSANAGFKLGDGGFFNITGEFIDQNVFDRSVRRPEIAPLIAAGIKPPRPTGNQLGQPSNRAYRVVWNAAVPVGDGDEVYMFGNYGWQRQSNDFNYRRPIAVSAQDIPLRPGTGTFSKSINSLWYLDRIGTDPVSGRAIFSETGRTFSETSIYPNGFVPVFEASIEDMSFVAGYKGSTEGGLKYDVTASFGRNQIRYFMYDTLNPSLGPTSPKDFYLGKVTQQEYNLNADFSYETDIGLYKPLFIAAGLEFRREAFAVGLGDRASWEPGIFGSQLVQRANGTTFNVTKPVGANGFPGFGPDSVAEGGRNNYSAYLDFEAEAVEGLDLGLAARYDYFNDFGSTFNGKFSARWAINDVIALRGAASTGFRAPTPGQQFTQNTQTNFPQGSPVPVAVQTARPDSLSATYFGSKSLAPEKSVSFSGGMVITPGGGFNVTIDAYNIVVRDRIGITSSVNLTLADQQALLAQGLSTALDLGQVNYFTNGFRTRTQGFDIVLSHRADTGVGRFNTSLAVNYNKTKVTDRKSIALSAVRPTDTRTLSLIDNTRLGNIEDSNPRWRAVLSENFTTGAFDFTARLNYFGKFTTYFAPIGSVPAGVDPVAFRALYPAPNPALNVGEWGKTFPSQVSLDFEAGFTVAENYRLAVGVENLFNTYPPVETRNAYPSTGGQANGSIYPGSAPIGQAGGFWYVRATAKF
ncbi:TonB-dependent receptor plug domain-containing protein [Sandarakinorhabdus limnophila]|jgi:iron complex outermembrane receptor protein|uniref:TonB-dependent receptor plug domain-containing protein n=1 Tax=Sandarakinorhabdus limnophila TaxID=210512 RepID=UPI0037C71D90